MKDSKQYPIGGFAPGYYYCKCVNCKQEFQGDKRSVQCEPCAIEMVNTKLKEGFVEGAKHQAKEMYSEEVLFQAFRKGNDFATMPEHDLDTVKRDFNKWLKQFKNEQSIHNI